MKRQLRYQLTRLIFPVIGCLLFAYFIYHLIGGDHGLLAWRRIQSELGVAKEELAVLKVEKEKMAHRVKLLQSGNLDEDMLDERARAMLDHAEGDEIILVE